MSTKEERVHVQGKVSIGATISRPDQSGTFPAVVFIMGTGKTDRDGNEKGFKTDFYRNLAEDLSGSGFVCIRYDKRGTFETEGDFLTAGLNDLMDDAVSVIQYAKELPYVDAEKVIVCGHSEGAMIATLLSDKEDTAGLLLLGGAGTDMKNALFYQNRLVEEEFQHKKGPLGWLLKSQTSQAKTNAKVEAMLNKCLASDKDKVFFGGAMMNARWIREHASHSSEDYVSLLKKYGKPILAITGTADLSTDYRRLSALEDIPFAQTFAPHGVNHILRKVDDDNSVLSVKKQYKRLAGQLMDRATEETIKEWLSQFRTSENRD